MADLFEAFATDTEKEMEGVWKTVRGIQVKVARVTNDRFAREYQALPPEIQDQIDNGTLPEEQAREVFADLMSKAILVDWAGLSLGGEEIPYSQEKAKEFLSREDLKDFRRIIWEIASTEANYRQEVLDTDVGKSSSGSGGSSSTEPQKPGKQSSSGNERKESEAKQETSSQG